MRAIWLWIIVALTLAPSLALAQALVSPFDVDARRALRGAPAGHFACPSPPPPQRHLEMDGFYADRGSGSSVVDPQAMRAYRAATEALNRFDNDLVRMADRYVASRPAEPRFAACALDWLAVWADAEAMLGRVSQQGGYVRKWGLAPAAASYLKIRGEPSLDAAKTQRVEAWLRRWARAVRDDYDSPERESRRNNHLYWAAWSVGLASVALDDRRLFDWAMDKARFGLRQVTAEGVLPLEMARKARAYHYHVFAAGPLVMVAELGAVNGVDLYGERDGALKRLVGLVIANFDDSRFFDERAGVKQDRGGSDKGPHFAWLETYYARTRDPAALRLLGKLTGLRERRIGGDLTLLFGVR